ARLAAHGRADRRRPSAAVLRSPPACAVRARPGPLDPAARPCRDAAASAVHSAGTTHDHAGLAEGVITPRRAIARHS
nr:hypothetical protein [Tanacetum cinerariifolium]